MNRLVHMAGGLWLALAAVLAGTLRADPPTSQPDRMTDDQLTALVAQLNDTSFQVRESASRKLSELPIGDLDRLIPFFKSSVAPEQQMRLRDAARTAYVQAKKSESPGEGFLGVTHVQTLDLAGGRPAPAARVQVTSVLADSPAERAGLQPGDQITALGGKAIPQTDGGFADSVRAMRPGAQARLTVERDGKAMEVVATLTSRGKFNIPGDDTQWVRQFNQYWREKFDPDDRTGDDEDGVRALGNGVIIIQGGGQIIFEP